MTTLPEQIEADLKTAMRAKDALRLQVLRMLKSAIAYAGMEKSGAAAAPADADVIAAIRKEVKKREEAATSFDQAGRKELADKERAELEILAAYLPPALSAEQIDALVREAIAQTGASAPAQMGVVIKAVQAKAGGAVDGKTLSDAVRRALAG